VRVVCGAGSVLLRERAECQELAASECGGFLKRALDAASARVQTCL